MSRLRNLLGQKIGMLLVTSLSHSKRGEVFWTCLCDCGNEVIRCRRTLTTKKTKEEGIIMYKDYFLLIITVIILSMTISMVTGCVTTDTKPDKIDRSDRFHE